MRRTLCVAVLLIALAFPGGIALAGETHLLASPCRVLDTRSLTGGFRSTLSFKVRGNVGSTQGGAANCGLPATSEGAIVNVATVSPAATGWMTMWAYGVSAPGTTTLNFSASDFATNDGVTVKLASFGATNDLQLSSSQNAYWIVDLVGWVGAAATDSIRGEILDRDDGTTPPTIDFALDGAAVPVVCAAPWSDVDHCNNFDVTDTVCVTGHLAPFPAVVKLIVHTMTSCP